MNNPPIAHTSNMDGGAPSCTEPPTRQGASELDPRDYPQLHLLCWDWSHTRPMTRRDAFARYERLWRHVDTRALGAKETELIRALTDEFGNGLFNV